MTGFVASPPPADPQSADTVAADGWWPGLSLAELRKAMRIGEAVTAERLRDAVLAGMASAWVDLAAWQTLQVDAGHADLAAVPAIQLGGQSRLVHAWRRAVSSYAAADLIETHRSVTATAEGRARVTEEEVPADQHRRNALAAVRDILGRSRARVKLL